ncbi:MAG: DUF4292 domain-containing protein [Bacteroidia bacterium]
MNNSTFAKATVDKPALFGIRSLGIGYLLLIVLLSACHTGKKITKLKAGTELFLAGDCRNTKALLDSMKKHQFHFETLSSKLDCEARGDSMKGNFEVTLRIKRDSVLWMNVSALGGLVKVARIVITQDSVFMVNYMDKRNDTVGSYFRGDYSYINKMLQSDFDFEMVQSILIGNPVTFYEENEKLRSYGEDGKCVLSTIRKRKLKKVVNRNRELTKTDSAQTIWLDPQTQKIAHLLFNDFNSRRSFDVSYSDFYTASNGLLVAGKVRFQIRTPEKNLMLEMGYRKVNLNKSLEFPFNIPEGYKRIFIRDPNGQH